MIRLSVLFWRICVLAGGLVVFIVLAGILILCLGHALGVIFGD